MYIKNTQSNLLNPNLHLLGVTNQDFITLWEFARSNNRAGAVHPVIKSLRGSPDNLLADLEDLSSIVISPCHTTNISTSISMVLDVSKQSPGELSVVFVSDSTPESDAFAHYVCKKLEQFIFNRLENTHNGIWYGEDVVQS